MENNTQRPINRTSSPTSSPMSAEEKLKRSMRGLSHMGGMGGGSLNSTPSRSKSKEKIERKKVGGVVLDMDTIQEATNQKFETKGGRNNIVIIILSLLLVASLVFLAFSVMRFLNGKKDTNLKYFVEGDAEWIIEGDTATNIALKDGLAKDMIYLIDSQLKINTTESVSIVIEIEVLLDGSPIIISGLSKPNDKLVRVDNTNNYVYQESVIGGGTIKMFEGIDFSDAPSNLSSDNVKINIKAIITKD